ncbi:hypothetical protein Tco_0143233, partial [Tanacetum coccineum]
MNAWVLTFLKDDQEVYSSDDELQDKVAADKDGANNNKAGDGDSHSTDPFNLYFLLNYQHKQKSKSSTVEPEYPPGFTLVIDKGDNTEAASLNVVNEQVQSLTNKLKERNMKDGASSQNNMKGGSILDVMDELVKVLQLVFQVVLFVSGIRP